MEMPPRNAARAFFAGLVLGGLGVFVMMHYSPKSPAVPAGPLERIEQHSDAIFPPVKIGPGPTTQRGQHTSAAADEAFQDQYFHEYTAALKKRLDNEAPQR